MKKTFLQSFTDKIVCGLSQYYGKVCTPGGEMPSGAKLEKFKRK